MITHTKADEAHNYNSTPGVQPPTPSANSVTLQANSESTTSKANSQSQHTNSIVTTLVGKIAAKTKHEHSLTDLGTL